MKTVFISRQLTAGSIFRKELQDAGLQVVGKSLIRFDAVTFSRIPRSDWVFFYSKKGVKFFFQQLKALNRQPSPKLKWACLGPATGKALKRAKIKADFIGTGSSLDTALSFIKIAKHQTVLFPRAKTSRQSIQDILEDQITAKDLIVYKNTPITRVTIPVCHFLVFTSPMNAETYFKHHTLQEKQLVFAIGRTTAKTLTGLGIDEIQIAEEPSEAALAKAVLDRV